MVDRRGNVSYGQVIHGGLLLAKAVEQAVRQLAVLDDAMRFKPDETQICDFNVVCRLGLWWAVERTTGGAAEATTPTRSAIDAATRAVTAGSEAKATKAACFFGRSGSKLGAKSSAFVSAGSSPAAHPGRCGSAGLDREKRECGEMPPSFRRCDIGGSRKRSG